MTGEKCKAIRQLMGIRQAEMCWTLQLDTATISRWESGLAKMRPENLIAVTNYLSDRLNELKQALATIDFT